MHSPVKLYLRVESFLQQKLLFCIIARNIYTSTGYTMANENDNKISHVQHFMLMHIITGNISCRRPSLHTCDGAWKDNSCFAVLER
jgi:hypothetical protein